MKCSLRHSVNLILVSLFASATLLLSTPSRSLAFEEVRDDSSDSAPIEFTPGLLRGRRPSSEAEVRQWIKSHSITMVLSLDDYYNDPSLATREAAWVKAAGVKFTHYPVHHLRGPSLEQLRAALGILLSADNERIYIHCEHGKDRTGLLVAAYRMKQQGWKLSEAMEELYEYGHSVLLAFWDQVLLRLSYDL